jgi:hypothetical protein
MVLVPRSGRSHHAARAPATARPSEGQRQFDDRAFFTASTRVAVGGTGQVQGGGVLGAFYVRLWWRRVEEGRGGLVRRALEPRGWGRHRPGRGVHSMAAQTSGRQRLTRGPRHSAGFKPSQPSQNRSNELN